MKRKLVSFHKKQIAEKRSFITDDGKRVYTGETIYKVMRGNFCLTSEKYEGQKTNSICLYFSTKSAADEWILTHYPSLSISDILDNTYNLDGFEISKLRLMVINRL